MTLGSQSECSNSNVVLIFAKISFQDCVLLSDVAEIRTHVSCLRCSQLFHSAGDALERGRAKLNAFWTFSLLPRKLFVVQITRVEPWTTKCLHEWEPTTIRTLDLNVPRPTNHISALFASLEKILTLSWGITVTFGHVWYHSETLPTE